MQLRALRERTYIRPLGSKRHVVFSLTVGGQPGDAGQQPLTLGMVLDRSGSMTGTPLTVAKAVTMRAVRSLTPRDQVAVLAFDDHFDVVHALAPVTPQVIEQLAAALDALDVRGSTALHEAWLTGCRLIASEVKDYSRTAHVMLLTDGQANQGITDTRTIAHQVADVRQQTAIGTSTFGLGSEYNHQLLALMAMAGEGQFTHLRSTADLEGSFLGVIDNLRRATIHDLRLELDVPTGVQPKILSQYWYRHDVEMPSRWSVALGDLCPGDERQVVVAYTFPALDDAPGHAVRARLVWRTAEGDEYTSAWEQVAFTYASDAVCSEEQRDPAAMHWIGLEQAAQAKRRAVRLSDADQRREAAATIKRSMDRLAAYSGSDAELLQELDELGTLASSLEHQKFTPATSKELYFRQQLSSRRETDKRTGE